MFREEGGGGRGGNSDGREEHQLVASPTHPDWGPNPKPFGVQERRSSQPSHQSGLVLVFKRNGGVFFLCPKCSFKAFIIFGELSSQH